MNSKTQAEPIVQALRLISVCSLAILALAFEVFAKPGAAVSLLSPSGYLLEPYSDTQITVEFSLPDNAKNLQIQMQTQGSVSVVAPALTQNIALEYAQTLLRFPVTLGSTDQGVSYLMFNIVVSDENGVSKARSLGLRLQVGEELKIQKQTAPSNNETFKELPSQEVISSK